MGTDGCGVGGDCTAAAREWQARQAMDRPPAGDPRHPLEVAHRSAVAGSARAVWSVADLLRSVGALAAGWRLGPIAPQVQTKRDAVGEVVWEVRLDSTTVRAHQQVGGARQRLAQADQEKGLPRRSRRQDAGAGAAG